MYSLLTTYNRLSTVDMAHFPAHVYVGFPWRTLELLDKTLRSFCFCSLLEKARSADCGTVLQDQMTSAHL